MDVILAVVSLGILTILLLYVGQRLKIPSIVSFLIIGILAGPYALGIVQDQSIIETIGEIGVILLLFTIGLEFSFDKLLGAWRIVVLGGTLQVVTTIVAASALMYLARGLQFPEAVFFGFLVSLSSTAIVMKILQERGDVETVPGRTLLGILIFQDLAIIPMILLTPLMMGSSGVSSSTLPYEVGKVVLIFIVLIISARWVVPFALRNVTALKSRELFIFTVAGICFAVAWLTNMAGLSYSLGAFVAGLIIGESEFSIDAVSNIIPFRDVFAAIFFMSIGMLLDTSILVSNYEIVATLVVVIIGVKVLTGSFSAFVLGMPVRVAVFVGLALAQIGEFSFVLAKSAVGSNLIGTGPYQFFLAGAIITMALTPFLMSTAPQITGLMYRFFPSFCSKNETVPADTAGKNTLENHIVIVGYGMTGKSVARAAELSNIPYTVIDLDPDVVHREQNEGGNRYIFFGDAVHQEVLEHAGIRNARAMVVVISEQNVVPGIIHLARGMSPDLYIIVRTRHVSDVQNLLDAGADEVIPEEFETSVSIFACVLGKYSRSGNEIDILTKKIRQSGYQQFNRATASTQSATGIDRDMFYDLRIHTLPLADGSPAAGKTLKELDAINRFSVGILAIRRGDLTITSPSAELCLEPGDLLVLNATDTCFQQFQSVVAGNRPAGSSPPASLPVK
ncbi:cation:proton antiporter [uncultured Methanoregula sp.]|uniref:cation:proton antiporter domain-containing protein n=1 Tax=uncultured Methanoregula sp. TaxID=1005933 RepID=UPI002AABC554|nr:cation:proton antiporter [uncultured Methanoregula sp.]